MKILAFDYGEDIVGMIDLHTDIYARYRGARMVDGARRIFACEGIVVSFNGAGYDLRKLAALAGLSASGVPPLQGVHYDMRIEASRDRWPPRPGTAPIVGCSLRDHYRHYCGPTPPQPPGFLDDAYERSNWLDCHMAAELWRAIVSRREPELRAVAGRRA